MELALTAPGKAFALETSVKVGPSSAAVLLRLFARTVCEHAAVATFRRRNLYTTLLQCWVKGA